jgi:hypothetical protein
MAKQSPEVTTSRRIAKQHSRSLSLGLAARYNGYEKPHAAAISARWAVTNSADHFVLVDKAMHAPATRAPRAALALEMSGACGACSL